MTPQSPSFRPVTTLGDISHLESKDTVSHIGSATAIQASNAVLGRRVTGQSGLDRVSTRGNQQYASSTLLVKTQDDKSLMVPEPHNLNAIRTYSVHHTASGRGATLSESPPTSPGTPDFADYGKDGRLRSRSIDNDFCSAATQSSQRHARPQRSQQAQLQYGRVKLLTKAKPAHASSAAAIEAAMIKPGNSSPSGQVAVGAGSTQLSPKASRQTPSVTAAQPSRIEAPSVSAGSNSNGQQHALMSPPAQSTMRSLRIGQGQMRRGHGSRRAKPLDILKVIPEDTVLLLSPKGTQQSNHPSLELNMVPQVRILRRPICSAGAEPVIRPGNGAEAAQVPQQSTSARFGHHAASEPTGRPGNLAAVPPTQVPQLRILKRPSPGAVSEPVFMSGNNEEAPQAQPQSLSAPLVRGTPHVTQRTRGFVEDLWWRAELALFRQQWRPRRLRKYKAIDKIEAAWLGYKARQRFQLMKKAALKLQAAYRCHLQRQRFVCLKAAAVKIQTAVRGHRSRQQFLSCKTAAIVVQRLWLCRRLRRSATAAVTALQGHDHTRGMLTPVAHQRQSSTKLASHLEVYADSAHWEASVRWNEAMRSLAYHTTTSQPGVVTDSQGTEAVEAGMEAELGHDYTGGMLTPVPHQRQSSTELASHLEDYADSAQWEALVRRNEAMRSLAYHTTTSQPEVVTDPQEEEEVAAGMEAELAYAVQEAPELSKLQQQPQHPQRTSLTPRHGSEGSMSQPSAPAWTLCQASWQWLSALPPLRHQGYSRSSATASRSRAAKTVGGASGLFNQVFEGSMGGSAVYRSSIALLGQHFVGLPPDTGLSEVKTVECSSCFHRSAGIVYTGNAQRALTTMKSL
ncbi:hypothetical protein WJX82_010433 [Trebouxia sp. C0006]